MAHSLSLFDIAENEFLSFVFTPFKLKYMGVFVFQQSTFGVSIWMCLKIFYPRRFIWKWFV